MDQKPVWSFRKWILFAFGPGVGWLVFACLRAATDVEPVAALIAMLCVWMAIWWMTEAVPLELTALLPMLVIPLTGLYREDAMMKACAPYAHENVYFFLGGFGLGLAIEKTQLHRRGALVLLRFAGSDAQIVVASFMACTALLSMWMNNTATTMLMLPLATSVIATKSDKRFATSLLIGIAYAASIGGMSTLVGTAPNIFFAGFLKDNDMRIGFLPWMAFALPTAVVILVGAWVWMVKILWPMQGLKIDIPHEWVEEWRSQPGWTVHQRVVMAIFAVVAAAWIFRDPLLWITKGDQRPLGCHGQFGFVAGISHQQPRVAVVGCGANTVGRSAPLRGRYESVQSDQRFGFGSSYRSGGSGFWVRAAMAVARAGCGPRDTRVGDGKQSGDGDDHVAHPHERRTLVGN